MSKHDFVTPGATTNVALLAIVLAASSAVAQQTGPSTGAAPYVLPTAPGVITRSLLTTGDGVADGHGGSYRLVGVPDGLGAWLGERGRITLFCNHELGATQGTARSHGGTGAFVSQWQLDAGTGAFRRGGDLIRRVRLWDRANGAWVEGSNVAFERFCSADLAAPQAFFDPRSERGTKARIFLNGEETRPPSTPDHGRAFAHVASGPEAGTSYELPALGRISFENVVASPFPQRKTIVVGNDDADRQVDPTRTPAPSELYVYVGDKQDRGNAVERAGLALGNLYGMKVTVGGVVVAQESNAFGLGTSSFVGEGQFRLHDFGDVRSLDGLQLQQLAVASDVTRLQRVEDGCWDLRLGHENTYYFVTTGNIGSLRSRLWQLEFQDIRRPELGGTIRILLDGTEGGEMFDNVCMDRRGHVLLQEDVGNNARLGRIWQYDLATDSLLELARHDAALFVVGAPGYLTQDEESSGILDATGLLGAGWFLAADQVHLASNDPELVEGGQLFALFNPDSARGIADLNLDGQVDVRDWLAFLRGFLQQNPAVDFSGDGWVTGEDLEMFAHYYRRGMN